MGRELSKKSLTFPVDGKLKDGSPAQFVLADERDVAGRLGRTVHSMAASRSDFGDYFGGRQATGKPEGAISLETELPCAVSDHPVGAPATYKGTPHTQYATEHHAGRNHSDAPNNPYDE